MRADGPGIGEGIGMARRRGERTQESRERRGMDPGGFLSTDGSGRDVTCGVPTARPPCRRYLTFWA